MRRVLIILLALSCAASTFAAVNTRLEFLTVLADEFQSPLTRAAFAPGGRLLAAGTENGRIAVWNTESGTIEQDSGKVVDGPIMALSFDSEGSRLAVASEASVAILDLKNGEAEQLSGDWREVSAIALSGDMLAWSGADRYVHVRPVRSKRDLRSFGPHSSMVQALTFAPNGTHLAAGELFRITRVWSLRTGCEQQTISNTSSQLWSLSYSADSRYLSVVSASGIQIAEANSGVEHHRFLPDSGSLLAAAFRDNGSVIAASWDNGLRLWRSGPLGFVTAPTPQRPVLHILAVGINGYPQSDLRLGFAQRDASEIAGFFERNSDRLAFEPRATRLLGKCASRAEISSVVDQLARDAKPEGALLLFLAGHGRQENGEFYFYPHDVDTSSGAAVVETAYPASELGRALARTSVERQLIIVDACQSGMAAAALRDAILRFADPRKSVHVLSASGENEEAMEIEDLGHGLLTSVLLQRLSQRASVGERETVTGLLEHASSRVPELAEEYNKSGSQVPAYRRLGEDFVLLLGRSRSAPIRAAPAWESAQAVSSSGTSEFRCRHTAADQKWIRPEGLSEPLGDVVLRCSGKPPAPKVPVKLYINTNFTGRQSTTGELDTMLILEEPGTRTEPGAYEIGQNAFAARQAGPNSIGWSSVPLPLSTPSGETDVQLRITGIRANANQLGVGGTDLSSRIAVYYEVGEQKGGGQVAYVVGSLSAELQNCDASGPPSLTFDRSVGENEQLVANNAITGQMQFAVRFRESFPDHFLPESGHQTPRRDAAAGTRLMLQIHHIPRGVEIYATVAATPDGTTPGARARLVETDATGAGKYAPANPVASGLCGSRSLGVARIPPSHSDESYRQIVWEIRASDPQQLDALSFGLMIAYEAQLTKQLPNLGTATVGVSYAPVSMIVTAAPDAPLPRFTDLSPREDFFEIVEPVSWLLFPKLINAGNRDSGVIIANASSVGGPCTLHFQGSAIGMPVNQSETSRWIGPGDQLVFTLGVGGSHGVGAKPAFAGCMLAECSFSSARGVYTFQPEISDPPTSPAIRLEPGTLPDSVSPDCVFEGVYPGTSR